MTQKSSRSQKPKDCLKLDNQPKTPASLMADRDGRLKAIAESLTNKINATLLYSFCENATVNVSYAGYPKDAIELVEKLFTEQGWEISRNTGFQLLYFKAKAAK